MFSLKEKRSPNGRTSPVRKRNFEAVVRAAHATMSGKDSEEGELLSRIADEETVNAADQSWDEMVFENRNREYGAYVLRKGYSNNVAVGIIITIVVLSLILLSPTLAKWLGGKEAVVRLPLRKLVYTELSAPPPIDKPKPLPPRVQLPRLRKVIKFVPPKVVKEEIIQQTPTLEEIKQNDIGATEVNTPTEVVFEEPVQEVVADDNELFTVVDQQPEFEGGYEAMMAFIKQNMNYPPNARRMRMEGTVHVSFIVSKSGAISDVTVLRGFMTECDKEAVRVVKLMPAWKPGKQNGRNVNVRFILPLKFRLN